jgi:DNA-binding phage protein
MARGTYLKLARPEDGEARAGPAQIAKQLGIGRASVYRALAANRQSP